MEQAVAEQGTGMLSPNQKSRQNYSRGQGRVQPAPPTPRDQGPGAKPRLSPRSLREL